LRAAARSDRLRLVAGALAASLACACACTPALAGNTNDRTLLSLPAQDWFCTDCQMPPTLAADGILYGTLVMEGANGQGVLYAVDPGRQGFKFLYDFTNEAGHPVGWLTAGSDGNFYGITASGGRFDGGTAYRLTRTGGFKILHDFKRGTAPVSLVEASDGALYGTTNGGGDANRGSIFRIDARGEFTQLVSFGPETGPIGSPPAMQLMEAFDYRLYGVSGTGGGNGTGTLYSYGLHDGTFKVDYSFGTPLSGDARRPNSRLIETLGGTFVGTSDAGGTHDLGTVFHMNARGEEAIDHSFEGGRDGMRPVNGVAQNPDSTLYGVSSKGGNGGGVAWRIKVTGEFGHLYFFGDKHSDGVDPAGFTWAVDGKLYGLCYDGGKYGNGTFFGLRLKPER
jgi:uncharacterized repeat protein (TIGR03803 family)